MNNNQGKKTYALDSRKFQEPDPASFVLRGKGKGKEGEEYVLYEYPEDAAPALLECNNVPCQIVGLKLVPNGYFLTAIGAGARTLFVPDDEDKESPFMVFYPGQEAGVRLIPASN